MSFSYSLALEDPISQVRLEIGDTSPVPGSGPKPDGSCYQDEEIAYFLRREGDIVGCAAAALCEALARAWASIGTTTIGQISEQHISTAGKYADQAKLLRAQYGYGAVLPTDGGNSLSVGTIDLGFQAADTGEGW
ncbi:MAG TPA: hypothetical protein PLC98_15825 [Anaerolineales bacterium]|nr:hypothetical protein [Anaerolineales bacterium]